MPQLAIRNLFFLTCAVVDLTKVRRAKSVRVVPFSPSTLAVFKTLPKDIFVKNGLVH